MNILCRIGLHAWGRWTRITIALSERGEPRGKVDGQVRTCARCGMEQTRRVMSG